MTARLLLLTIAVLVLESVSAFGMQVGVPKVVAVVPQFVAGIKLGDTVPLPIPSGGGFALGQSEYVFHKNLAQHILRQYPSSQYFYLTAGRSMTVLQALLERIEPGSAANLPATKAKWATPLDILGDEDRQAFRAHFRRFLPTDERLSGRRLLIIDHVQSGLGLKHLREYVEKLAGFKNRTDSLAVVGEGLVRAGSRIDASHIVEQGHHVFMNSDPEQLKRFADETYDGVAPYTEANFVRPQSLVEVRKNPSYNAVVVAVGARLQGDSELKPTERP